MFLCYNLSTLKSVSPVSDGVVTRVLFFSTFLAQLEFDQNWPGVNSKILKQKLGLYATFTYTESGTPMLN